jgi:small GTP-binding protein
MSSSASFIKGKVIFVGDTSVGKTSLINRFRRLGGGVMPTVAAQTSNLEIPFRGVTVPVTVYDTAGQEDYRCLVPLYARGAQIAVIVYSEDSPATFGHVRDWMAYLENNAAIPHTILIGNKADLVPVMASDDAESFAEREGMPFLRTSAHNGQNVDALFAMIAEFVETSGAGTDAVTVAKIGSREAGGGCACALV